MLFTLSLNRIQSVPVDLPVARDDPNPSPEPPKDLLTIQVSDQGNLYLEPRVDRHRRASRPAGAVHQADPGRIDAARVLVAGDDRAKWGVTVQVLDEVRKAHIEKVSMETRTRDTGK